MLSTKHNGNVMDLLRWISEIEKPNQGFHVEGNLLWFETGYSHRVECHPGDMLCLDDCGEFFVITAQELTFPRDDKGDLPF